MDTVSPNPKTDNKHSDITNIPLGKWFHVIIRLQNRTLDTYINGIITSRLYLINVPKQNYDPIHICNNSGFFGDYSDLSYFNYALPITKIQSMVHTGPRLSYSEQHIQSSNSTLSRGSTNNYLSPLWYFNGNASDYEITPPDEETTTTTTTNGKDKDTAKTNLPANSGDVFVDEHKINNENYDASGNLVEKGIVLTNQDSLKEDVGKAEATVTELRQDSIPFSLNDTRFSTPFSSLMGGDVRALDNHNIDCGNTSINSFNYNNPGDGTFNYKYSCNNVGGGTLNTTDFLPTSTMFSDTTGKVTDLKTQKVECENNSVLSQFKLVNNTAIGDEKNASQLQYQYKCLKSNEPKPLTCRTLNTSSSSTTDNSRFLSKANIKCNPNEALSGFQYVNDGSNKFHYSYTCCSTAYST
jgi:hypothetical protein